MKMIRRSLLWVLLLALPASLLLLLPLRAQEKNVEAAPTPEPPATNELPPDERVSADNNLSFPVDI